MGDSRRPVQLGTRIVEPAVYFSTDLENWEFDPYLHPVEITLCAGKEGGEAMVKVETGPYFSIDEAREKYLGLDRYIAIDTGEDGTDVTNLFAGRIVRPAHSINGTGLRSSESLVLDCEHLCKELGTLWVAGRYIIDDKSQDPSEENMSLIPERTIFNYRGKPNRHAATFKATMQDVECEISLFSRQCDGFDADAKAWTYRQVLVYLLYHHGYHFDSDKFKNFDLADLLTILADTDDKSEMAKSLNAQAVELDLDCMELDESIDKVLVAAGIKYGYNLYYGDEQFCSVKLWLPGIGTEKYFQLARPATNVIDGWGNKSTEQLLLENNLSYGEFGYDSSRTVTAVQVIGEPARVEFTAELVPGWPNDTVLDVTTSEAITAAKNASMAHWSMDKDTILTDTWYRLYHKDSSAATYGTLQYGRLWVLNEDGEYPLDSNKNFPYNRATFNINTRMGLVKVFADYLKKLSAVIGTVTLYQSKRPRKLLPCLTSDRLNKSIGIQLEVSYDSGTNWHVLPTGCAVLDERCGVFLRHADMSKLSPKGVDDPSIANAWWSILDKTFRVRVTASIELDTELTAIAMLSDSNLRWCLHRDKNLRLWKKILPDNTIQDLAYSKANGARVQEYDDYETALNLGTRILQTRGQYQLPGKMVIPWLETEYELGDVIKKVEGREIPLALTIGTKEILPDIHQITWRMDQSWSTEYSLCDNRMASRKV